MGPVNAKQDLQPAGNPRCNIFGSITYFFLNSLRKIRIFFCQKERWRGNISDRLGVNW